MPHSGKLVEQELTKILKYNWPGNVRELKNYLERLLILGSGYQIPLSKLPDVTSIESLSDNNNSEHKSLESILANTEKTLILEALETSQGKKQVAADMLGISRHTLKRYLKKHNISK